MAEPANELSFDQTLVQLRQVVDRLEGGQASLEDSLKAFEEGVGLARRGHALLDAAEKRVEVLTRGPNGPKVAPFDEGSEG